MSLPGRREGLTYVDPADVCRRYGSSVLRRCRAILGDPDEAEDAAQEVYVRVMTKWQQFRSESAVPTWLYRITTNVCLNWLRADKRRRGREQSERVIAWADVAPKDPYEHYASKDRLQRMGRELDRLEHAVFVYRFVDGMTLEEIAQTTGKSRRTVTKRLKKIETLMACEQAQ